MASVNWGGNHGSARCSKADHVKGINLLKHCDQKFRSDPDRQHSNEEIDPSKSYLNQNFTGMDWKTSKEKWEKRLKELDATVSQTQRKDRIELTSLEMPVPEGMTNEQAREFFQDFYNICVKKFGEENIIGATSHFDEIAPYRDASDGEIKVSRPHIHVQVVPVVNGKLNNKEFSSLPNIYDMNKQVEKLCSEKYHLRFNTGETPRKKRTEQLKKDSRYVEKLVGELNQSYGYLKNIDIGNNKTAYDDFMEGGNGTAVNQYKSKVPETLLRERDDAYSQLNDKNIQINQLTLEIQKLKEDKEKADYRKKCIERGLELEENGTDIKANLNSVLSQLEQNGREDIEFQLNR